jgi:hypothetical protein
MIVRNASKDRNIRNSSYAKSFLILRKKKMVNEDIGSQLDLFTKGRAVARGTDPETSWEAAASIANLRESQAKVYIVLAEIEPATDEEIYDAMMERRIGISESGCRTRRNELKDLGLVEFAEMWGKTHLGNRSRMWQTVSIEQWKRSEMRKVYGE